MSQLDVLQLHEPQAELISASWKRCRARGMLPGWPAVQSILSEPELRREREENSQLRRLAQAEMRLLEHSLEGSGRVLLLADARGIVLDYQGDRAFLGRAQAIALMPGADWSETVTGTNAIGTALIAHRFVRVIGPQHFVEQNRFLACTAMPILSPTGRLAGVLDISGSAQEQYAAAARLVRHAVAHIEHAWALESAADVLVRLHSHPSWMNTPEEGVLSFQDGRLHAANARGMGYLGLPAAAIGRLDWDEIFEEKLAYGRQELRPRHTGGLCYASVERAHARALTLTGESAPFCETKLQDLKDDALRRALMEENGNISAAARRLGVNRSTFYRRLKAQRENADGDPVKGPERSL